MLGGMAELCHTPGTILRHMSRFWPRALLTVCLLHLGVLRAVAGAPHPVSHHRVLVDLDACRVPGPAFADFDQNGVPDRVDVGARSGTTAGVRVSLNGGRARLIKQVADTCRVLVADIDHDSDPDLIALTKSGRLLVWRNEGGRLRRVQPRRPPSTHTGGTTLHDDDYQSAARLITASPFACLQAPPMMLRKTLDRLSPIESTRSPCILAIVNASPRAPPFS